MSAHNTRLTKVLTSFRPEPFVIRLEMSTCPVCIGEVADTHAVGNVKSHILGVKLLPGLRGIACVKWIACVKHDLSTLSVFDRHRRGIKASVQVAQLGKTWLKTTV